MRRIAIVLLILVCGAVGVSVLARRSDSNVTFSESRVLSVEIKIEDTTAKPEAAVPIVAPIPVSAQEVQPNPKTVRVAAIQMASDLGRITANRERMSALANQAATLGAQMVVFPECVVQGYMEVAGNRTWSKEKDGSGEDVALVATSVPGSITRHFGEIAKARKIYIALPLIEAADGEFYNSLVLLGPDGTIVAQHRKNSLWPPGDGLWVTAGSGRASTVDTPFGRVGLMICHDLHTMPPILKKAGADIVLYAVGWYGPNVENWYRDIFPRRYVKPNHFAVVAANWSVPPGEKDWGGAGYSCVIDADGSVVSMAKTPIEEEIVIGELGVRDGAGRAAVKEEDE